MNEKKLESYRKRLLAEFDQVTEEIGQHTSLADRDVDAAVVNSDDKLRGKIELALKRIDEGTYGKCMQCNGQIPVARLDAKPSVSLCTKCQEEKERR